MANVLVEQSSLEAIANAIRAKNGTQNTYKPSQMADAIEAISGGGIVPSGTISITENGTHDVTNYASASVNVPTGGSTPVINPLSVTENGTYTAPTGVDDYSPITVNVPQGTTPTGTKQISITANGTTTEDVTNYASAEITVNVPTGGGGNFASGTYTPETNSNSWSIDVGNSYDHFFIYATTDSAGKSVRAIRSIVSDFSVSNPTLLVVTTNNTGGGIQGFYYTTGWLTKSGTVVTYSNGSNYFPAGVTYQWIAW